VSFCTPAATLSISRLTRSRFSPQVLLIWTVPSALARSTAARARAGVARSCPSRADGRDHSRCLLWTIGRISGVRLARPSGMSSWRVCRRAGDRARARRAAPGPGSDRIDTHHRAVSQFRVFTRRPGTPFGQQSQAGGGGLGVPLGPAYQPATTSSHTFAHAAGTRPFWYSQARTTWPCPPARTLALM